MSVRNAGETPIHSLSHSQYTLDELLRDPRAWSFSHLSFWLRDVTRSEAPDREWIHAIRVCMNSRSEALWQKFAGALVVPPGFEEEEEEGALADEDEFMDGPEREGEYEVADEGAHPGGEELDFEEEYDPSPYPNPKQLSNQLQHRRCLHL